MINEVMVPEKGTSYNPVLLDVSLSLKAHIPICTAAAPRTAQREFVVKFLRTVITKQTSKKTSIPPAQFSCLHSLTFFRSKPTSGLFLWDQTMLGVCGKLAVSPQRWPFSQLIGAALLCLGLFPGSLQVQRKTWQPRTVLLKLVDSDPTARKALALVPLQGRVRGWLQRNPQVCYALTAPASREYVKLYGSMVTSKGLPKPQNL